MALSDYEKKVLAEMEHHLRQQDPALADAMSKAAPKPAKAESEEAPPKQFSPRRVALGGLLATVGLVVVLVGVTMGFSWLSAALGALGFLLMVFGVLYALRADTDGAGRAQRTRRKGVAEATPGK